MANGYAKYSGIGGSGGGGTVTSVGLEDTSTVPIYTITGSPVVGAGTIDLTLDTQSANTIFAGPSSGAAAEPTFRPVVAADLPNLSGTYVPQSEVGAPNGVASLDSAGHIPLSQLPATLVEYLGTWSAATNTPTLANGTGVSGQFYIVSAAGTVNFGAGNITFNVGDWVLYNGTVWERAVQSNVVQSVNGQTGVVTVNAINQLSGDATTALASGSQAEAVTLATVNSNVGSFTNASVTVNAKGLITAASSGSTPGTVNSVSVVSANGLAGTVASPTTTPAITLSTTLTTPAVAGNGTALIPATTTGTGSTVVLATGPTMTNPVVGTQTQLNGSTLAASTSYVDTAVSNAVAGVNPAVAVQAATTTASNTSGLTYNNGVGGIGATFTGTTNTAIVVDGFTFSAVGQRLLVKNDTQSPSGAFNGIYNVTQIQTSLLPPILTRALDYDTPPDMNNTGVIPVINGTVNSTTTWLQTAQIVTVGTTPLVFVRFSASPAAFPTVTGWASYTPTLTGVGTPTINYCLFKQVGDSICVMISFMAGTVSATLFTITLPNSYVTSSLIGVNTTVVGNAAVGASVGANFVALVVGSTGFLYMGRQDAGNTGLAQSTASNMFGSSEQVAFTTTLIPIQGLGP